MDLLNSYRAKVKKILGDFANLVQRTSRAKEIETVCLFDEVRDNYMVYRVGWEANKRIHTTSIFIRIIDGKIWLEEDWTQIEVAKQLLDGGVSKENLCIGFHHPLLREEAETAVA